MCRDRLYDVAGGFPARRRGRVRKAPDVASPHCDHRTARRPLLRSPRRTRSLRRRRRGRGDPVDRSGADQISPALTYGDGSRPENREGVMAKRALLIGINKYQIAGADLRGCVNDVKALSAALVEFHGFTTVDIAVLTDGDATKKAMEAGIKKLVRESKKGDVALLHYSGHGSNVPTTTRTRPTAATRSSARPISTGTNPSGTIGWHHLRRSPRGRRFTVIMDCCHSCTTLAPSCARAPSRSAISRSLGFGSVNRRSRRRRSQATPRAPRATRKANDIVNAALPEVLVTGCRDTRRPPTPSSTAPTTGAHLCTRRGDSPEQGSPLV